MPSTLALVRGSVAEGPSQSEHELAEVAKVAEVDPSLEVLYPRNSSCDILYVLDLRLLCWASKWSEETVDAGHGFRVWWQRPLPYQARVLEVINK